MRPFLLKILMLSLSITGFHKCFATNPLAGTYTLDPSQTSSATNFTSFSALASHLNTYGVSDSVTINVAGGIYYEHMALNNIPGTSANNRITIQASPNDSIRPTLNYSATTTNDDYIIKLTHVSFLTIRNMNLVVGDTMYGNIIDLNGGDNSHITFENDSLITIPDYFTGSNSWPIPVYSENFLTGANHHISFLNNYIYGGMTSFRFRAGSTSTEAYITLDGNEIVGWRSTAMLMEDFDHVSIRNNRMEGFSEYGGNGIVLSGSVSSEIVQNKISVTGTGWCYGILVNQCTGYDIIGNEVNTSTASDNTGIEIRDSEGTNQDRSLVANNMVAIETHTYVHPFGWNDIYGIHANNSSYTNYAFNSILIYGDSTRSTGFLIELPNGWGSSSTSNNIYNNNIVNHSKSHAIKVDFVSQIAGVDSLNYNNYFSNGSHIGEYGSPVANLQQWKTQTNYDSQSLNVNPNFFSNTDLHTRSPQLDGAAKVLSYVNNDIDLETRSTSTPDIGADEYYICYAPDSINLDSLDYRFASASWSSQADSTFWILSNLNTALDTSSYSTSDSLLMPWLIDDTPYQLKIWHYCNPQGVLSDTITLNFATPACPQVNADFSYTRSFLSLSFNGSLSAGQDSVYWSFGDSAHSNQLQAYHSYDSAGYYKVVLEVFNSSCNDTSYIDSLIRVCDTVYSVFNLNQSQLEISAYSQSTNADSLQWFFGDGSSAIGDSIQHTYSQNGNYHLTLIAFNACGEPDTSKLMISVCDTLHSAFSLHQSLLQITAVSQSANADSLLWLLGDGSSAVGDSVQHTYSQDGNYLLTLIGFNACGESDTSKLMITVCNFSQASFTYQIVSQDTLNTYVQFDGTNSVNAYDFVWDFGDGNFDSTSLNPLHLYPSGTHNFTAQLKVFNLCGDVDSSQLNVSYISVPEQFVNSTFQLFPNPVRGKFTVEFPKGLQIDLLIIRDMTGRTVMEFRPTPFEAAMGAVLLNVDSDLKEGFYNLEIRSSEHHKGINFLVQPD